MGSAVCASAAAWAQASGGAGLPAAPEPNQATLLTVLAGGVRVERATGGPLPLSLDDAIARALLHNVQVEGARQSEQVVRGQVLTEENSLLPNLSAQVSSSAEEINLAAMGFKLSSLGSLLGPDAAADFKTIVKVNVTSAELRLQQPLFNLPAYFLYRSASKARAGANFTTLNVRGGLVLEVGGQYLRVLADAAQIANARALERSDARALQQAVDAHRAGTATNLDELRARVTLQTQQQQVIQAENAYAKDKVQLNRLMGMPAEQELQLTDTVPYRGMAEIPLPIAMDLATAHRKDLLNLESQVEVATAAEKAIRYQRLPTVGVNGFYGVLGETTGLYHGVFTAEGTVRFPIFREAEFRGEEEVAATQLRGLRQQIAALHDTIEGQIRSSMLDVESANDQVRVARSNVELAQQEMSDAEQRFAAGVTDNLPVVQAQATLAGAENQLVQTTFQYNTSKLELARNTGVVETQYRVYLGR